MSNNARHDLGGMLFAGGFLLLGAWGLYESREMSDLGAIFPRTIGAAMIGLSALYILYGLVRPRSVSSDTSSEQSNTRRVLLLVTMAVWIALISVIGFVSSSLIGFLGLTLIGNYDRWTPTRAILYLITAICTVAGFYALFAYALQVPLPKGSLF